MPRPGSPEALLFDKMDVSKFLRKWNQECDDYGLNEQQRCLRFPDYCTPEIEDVVICLSGYHTVDWVLFQQELKDLFWQHETQCNTVTRLRRLVHNGPAMDADLFVVQYSAISAALVEASALTLYDRHNGFMDGLPSGIQKKVLDHAAEEGWKLFAGDSEGTPVDFDTLKSCVSVVIHSNLMRKMFEHERVMRNIDWSFCVKKSP